MADLLKFPTQRELPPSTYQLHRFAPGGGVLATLLIRARTDAAARRRARKLADGVRAELWSGGRFLDHYSCADHPIAASIQVLSDPARITDASDPNPVRTSTIPE